MTDTPRALAAELNDTDWAKLGDAVRRLEDSWRTRRDAEIGQFVPPVKDPLRKSVLVELIKVDQECRWESGRQKPLEDYLVEWPELADDDPAVVELLTAECLTRTVMHDAPTVEDLKQRFPDLHTRVDLAELDATAISERPRPAEPIDRSDTSAETIAYTPSLHESRPLLAEGTRLGRYEIRRMIGQGGMGAVYLAWDEDLRRQVAVKVPHQNRFDSSAGADRFLEEARTVARLEHHGIVQVHDVGQCEDGTPFVVMEYVEGSSLAERLQADRIAPARAARWMVQIADALQYAHRQGFVHRDLKPSNILLDVDENPRVADFGLAIHETDQRHRAGEYCGTPAYMAPEQVRGETHRLDGRSDIWSLGVICYEMLTGKLPFGGPAGEKLSDEILHRDPKPPRQFDDRVPAALQQICLQCLSKEMTGRYQAASDLGDALRQWIAAADESIPLAGTREQASPIVRPWRRQVSAHLAVGRVGCGFVVGVACLLIAVTATLWYAGNRSRQIAQNVDPSYLQGIESDPPDRPGVSTGHGTEPPVDDPVAVVKPPDGVVGSGHGPSPPAPGPGPPAPGPPAPGPPAPGPPAPGPPAPRPGISEPRSVQIRQIAPDADAVPAYVFYVASGSETGPGKVYQVDEHGRVLGVVNLPHTPTGLALHRDKGLICALPRDGGRIMKIDDTGKLSTLIEKDKNLVHPVDVAVGGDSDSVVVADNIADVLVTTNTSGIEPQIYKRFEGQKSSAQDMSIAVTRDKAVILGTASLAAGGTASLAAGGTASLAAGDKGIYRISGDPEQPTGSPLLPEPGGVAADPKSPRWAATQKPNQVYIFEGDEMIKRVPLPPNKSVYHDGLLSFSPAGSVCVAVRESDSPDGPPWLLMFNIEKGEIRSLFSWTRETMTDFVIGPRMYWKRESPSRRRSPD